jgi:hypothetical protein
MPMLLAAHEGPSARLVTISWGVATSPLTARARGEAELQLLEGGLIRRA